MQQNSQHAYYKNIQINVRKEMPVISHQPQRKSYIIITTVQLINRSQHIYRSNTLNCILVEKQHYAQEKMSKNCKVRARKLPLLYRCRWMVKPRQITTSSTIITAVELRQFQG